MSRQDKIERIILATTTSRDYIPDRNGSTPLSSLADELAKLNSHSVYYSEYVDAMTMLLSGDEVPTDDKISYHDLLSTLAMLVGFLQIDVDRMRTLGTIFHRISLTNDVDQPVDARLQGMLGAVRAGIMYDLDELNNPLLREVLASFPAAWIETAIISNHYTTARRQIIDTLENGTLNINALIMSLDSWHDKWERGVDFFRIVRQISASVSSTSVKNRLRRWLERRGQQSNNIAHQGTLVTLTQKTTDLIAQTQPNFHIPMHMSPTHGT